MDENRHRITINIAGKDRHFSNIAPEEEEFMRMAAKMITNKMEDYKKKYAGLSDQDALSVTSLIFVTQLIKERRNNSVGDFENRIAELNNTLDEYIKTNL
jgi:cell division protein ZapA (FtsZ GTPase activity inhibitor)